MEWRNLKETFKRMLLRTVIVVLGSSVMISVAATKPIVYIDFTTRVTSELEKTAVVNDAKRKTVMRVVPKIVQEVNALPDKETFLVKMNKLAEELNVDPALLLVKFHIESKINPSAKNPNTKASGIFQAMKGALPPGISLSEFRQLSATEQLDYYAYYIKPYSKYIRPGHIEDLYVANLCPRALIKNHKTLYKRGTPEYEGNKGLDLDNDGRITRTDLRNLIESYLIEEDE